MSVQRNPSKLSVESLEAREMMSISSASFSAGVVTVWSDNNATSVRVNSGNTAGGVKITDTDNGRTWNYSGVVRVDFVGGASNDRFVNNISTLNTRAWGNGGNDYLEGYNGNDSFVGGAGNDTLVGYGGADSLFGDAGNDFIRGMDGNDQLIGGTGMDTLNGGAGTDQLWGGDGDDILIVIDNGTTDSAQGDAGSDAVWADLTGSVRDSAPGLTSLDRLRGVGAFANGADRTLNGDNIADPTLKSGSIYKRFSGPLFSSAGPQYTDVRQGSLGDCWLLAGLSAIALDSPTTLRQNVVDFGDGTYGVRLGSSYYRVDGDLPVASSSSTDGSYAKLGAQDSMWVAVVEKAYTHYRTGANSYASIESGWAVDVNRAFGTTSAVDRSISSYSSATALGNALYSAWLNYGAATIGFTNLPAGAPLVDDHMYTVISFTRDSNGNVTHVTLRNPWGTDGAGNDGVNDGLVKVAVGTLFACSGRVNWGRV